MKMTLDSRLSPPVAKQLKGGEGVKKTSIYGEIQRLLSQEKEQVADVALYS